MNTKIVSVVMITYGHNQFIHQAIEGVLMQKCDFEIELIIANDCSPDNTDKVVEGILQRHPNANWINYTKHSENKGMMSNFIWALQQAQSKYIALCDGDDYWTDPLKLQKQVDFLEGNSHVSSVCTNASFSDGHGQEGFFFDADDFATTVYKFRAVYEKNIFPTLTGVFKNTDLFQSQLNTELPLLDWALVVGSMNLGSVVRLNIVTAHYRIHDGGIFSHKSHDDRLMSYIVTANNILSKANIKHKTILANENKIKARYLIKNWLLQKNIRALITHSVQLLRPFLFSSSLNYIHKKFKNVKFVIDNGCSIEIGDNVRFRHFNSIIIKNHGELTIGNNCFFNSYTSINCLDSIRIGDNSIFGEGVKIYDHNHEYNFVSSERDYSNYKTGSIEIGRNCWIASNVVILAGVKIGDNVVIGAGCLIRKDVPSNSILKNKQDIITE